MIKHFCDMCESEITSRNAAKGGDTGMGTTLKRKGVWLQVEVATKGANESPAEFCKYCILDALYKLDDRPRDAAAPQVIQIEEPQT